MHGIRTAPLILSSALTLVLLPPACLAVLPPNAHDPTPSEMFGLRSAFLSQEAQGKLTELENRLKDAHEKGDAQAEAGILDSIGLQNYANQRFDEALDAFSGSLQLYRQVKAESSVAAELCEIGATYAALGMDQKALDAYKEALPLWRLHDRDREAATLGKIAEVFRTLHDPGEALHFDQMAFNAYAQTGDFGGQATVLNNIGLAYFSADDKKKAVSYFDKARATYHVIANRRGEATALNNLAVAYAASGDNSHALGAFNHALELHRQGNNRGAEAVTLNSIGVVYSRMGEPQAAHGFFEQAASIYRAMGDQKSEALELNAINLEVSDSKRRGHKKKTYPDQGLNTGASGLPVSQ